MTFTISATVEGVSRSAASLPRQGRESLGANPQLFRPCTLSASKPCDWTSLPATALGAEKSDVPLLVTSFG